MSPGLAPPYPWWRRGNLQFNQQHTPTIDNYFIARLSLSAFSDEGAPRIAVGGRVRLAGCDAPLSAAYQKQGFLLGAYASHARYASRNLLRVIGMSWSSSFWMDWEPAFSKAATGTGRKGGRVSATVRLTVETKALPPGTSRSSTWLVEVVEAISLMRARKARAQPGPPSHTVLLSLDEIRSAGVLSIFTFIVVADFATMPGRGRGRVRARV